MNSRTSVTRPVSAEAAAVAGLARCVRDPAPWRPTKLRLEVETQRLPAATVSPLVPTHIVQPGWPQVNPALMKPVQPDAALSLIVGSKPLARGPLTKKLWEYIKANKLQDAKKRTMINADDALKVIFNGKKQVSMFEMTKLVSKHVK